MDTDTGVTPRELTLRYGCNPHQTPAHAAAPACHRLPIRVLAGSPGYINLLDAFNSWQLVQELRAALGLPAAASFKHVSPAGAAVAVPLSAALARAYFVADLELSPLATAYARARGADRVSSYGDWIALSDPVDEQTARLIGREVSDGIIAPGYAPAALAILRRKKGGKYHVVEVDPGYTPADTETRHVFGVTLEQQRNTHLASAQDLADIATQRRDLPAAATRDLLVALIALKYTQSNSVCLAVDGQVIGMGAGQQSRIHCTRLAATKADTWYLRQHPAVLDLRFRRGLRRPDRDNAIDQYLLDALTPAEARGWREAFRQVPQRLSREEKQAWLKNLTGVALGSDGFIPFRDNIDRASASGVQYVAQPGGSLRDEPVIEAGNEYGMVMALTGVRLFHH